MAEFVSNFARLNLADGTIALTTAGGSTGTPCYLMLLTTGWNDVANPEDLDYLLNTTTSTSPVHFEISSGSMGSTARQYIGQSTATEDDTGNLAYVTASTAITFTSVSSGAGDIGAALIFAQIAASDSSGRIIVSGYDTSFPKTPNGGDITVNFSTGGWLQYTT